MFPRCQERPGTLARGVVFRGPPDIAGDPVRRVNRVLASVIKPRASSTIMPRMVVRSQSDAAAHKSRSSPELEWLKLRRLEDDQLWSFSSSAEYWQGLAGRAGIALVRGGRVIDHVLTVMS
jgi:hypothetical protein